MSNEQIDEVNQSHDWQLSKGVTIESLLKRPRTEESYFYKDYVQNTADDISTEDWRRILTELRYAGYRKREQVRNRKRTEASNVTIPAKS